MAKKSPSIGSTRQKRGSPDAKAMPKCQEDRLREQAQLDVVGLIASHLKYGDSWRKKGGLGAYFTLARKIDRYERACEMAGFDVFQAVKNTPASDGTLFGKDSLLDDITDLRRYLLLLEEFVTRRESETHDQTATH